MDSDSSGKVDRQELLNALKVLPRPEGSFEKVPLEDIIKTLDVDVSNEDINTNLLIRSSIDSFVHSFIHQRNTIIQGDGLIDQDEWLARIETLPGLKASIEQAVDKETGQIPDSSFALLSSPAPRPPDATPAPAEAAAEEAAAPAADGEAAAAAQ
jgi:hypothetical protein